MAKDEWKKVLKNKWNLRGKKQNSQENKIKEER